jgi:hypothetical protein
MEVVIRSYSESDFDAVLPFGSIVGSPGEHLGIVALADDKRGRAVGIDVSHDLVQGALMFL